jgi:hypothetical protein
MDSPTLPCYLPRRPLLLIRMRGTLRLALEHVQPRHRLDAMDWSSTQSGVRQASKDTSLPIHLCLECRGVSNQNSSSQCPSRYHLSGSSVTSARTPDCRIHDWHIAFPSCNFNWMASLFYIAFVKSPSCQPWNLHQRYLRLDCDYWIIVSPSIYTQAPP